MLRSRRFAFAAAAVLMGITACGDPDQAATDATIPVIRLGAGGPTTGQTAGGAPESANADARMMMPWGGFEYVYQGEWPTLPAASGAWYFPATSSPDLDQLRRIAAAFGVVGDPVQQPAENGGGWVIGSSDYTGASVTLAADGMLSWWFNPDPSVYERSGTTCPVIDTPVAAPDEPGTTEGGEAQPIEVDNTDAIVVEVDPVECIDEPLPPAGVPSADQAKALATELFSAMGYEPGTLEFDASGDEWGAYVTGWLKLDGARSPLAVSVGYGADAQITWASGFAATPQRGADYPVVSPQDGLVRLQDQALAWTTYGGGDLLRTTDVAVGMPEPMPIDNGEVPPPILVTLTGVRLDLTMVWDVDGAVWLLPAYTFTDADGGQYTVIAVDDSFIDLPAPEEVPVESVPVDTLPVETVVPDTTDSGEVPAPVEADLQEATEGLLGLDEVEAAKLAEEFGWEIRVVERDGESFAVTADYRTNRVNVVITGGVISAVQSIG